jgi:hypothetical protein
MNKQVSGGWVERVKATHSSLRVLMRLKEILMYLSKSRNLKNVFIPDASLIINPERYRVFYTLLQNIGPISARTVRFPNVPGTIKILLFTVFIGMVII